MKKFYLFILILILSLSSIANAGIRCNRYIISKGDHKYSVERKMKQCGEILGKEVIQSGSGNIKREEWFVKINNMCHLIKFCGGIVKDFGVSERCK